LIIRQVLAAALLIKLGEFVAEIVGLRGEAVGDKTTSAGPRSLFQAQKEISALPSRRSWSG